MKIFPTVRFTFQKSNLTTQVLPSFFVMALVLIARALGILEPLDLIAFDIFLKLRPPEPPDDRITLIKITQNDIQRWGGYPISNEKIVELVEELQHHKPTVIGLNLLGDLLPDKNPDLITLFEKYDNLVIAEKILPPQILAPKGIHPDQIGFTDIQTDQDNHLRRVILGSANPVNLEEFKFSFATQLAQKYLSTHGYILENGLKKTDAMRFSDTEIPLLEKNYGGYVGIDAGGIQTMLNYRQHSSPFQALSVQAVEQKDYSPNQITQEIIIIGVTDPNTRRNIKTLLPAPFSLKKRTGVDIQGYVVSQIISAVLDERILLRWNYRIEFIWFTICILAYHSTTNGDKRNQFKKTILMTSMSVLFCYLGIFFGYWIPFSIPVSFFFLNGFAWMIINRIKREREGIIHEKNQKNEIKKESELRRKVIERIFSIIHNGPLQTLSNIIRDAKTKGDLKLIEKLENLDLEIRRISDLSKHESFHFHERFYLGCNEYLDLNLPLHELFYQLFSKTICREFSEFKKIKITIRSFEPISAEHEEKLSFEIKRELCCFLEEMLCNVEKHGIGVSNLRAIGNFHKKYETYRLRIEDNGSILNVNHQGEGTKHAEQLACKLKGSFSRIQLKSGGTRCELNWPLDI